MKTKPNTAIKELRRIIGRTQNEFANLIGVTKDAVVNWENGRNKLSGGIAFRIQFITGASADSLLSNEYPLVHGAKRRYSPDDWQARKDYDWAVESKVEDAFSDLKLIMAAAKVSGRGKLEHRLRGVVFSFMQWAYETMVEFDLATELFRIVNSRPARMQEPYFVWFLNWSLWHEKRRKYIQTDAECLEVRRKLDAHFASKQAGKPVAPRTGPATAEEKKWLRSRPKEETRWTKYDV